MDNSQRRDFSRDLNRDLNRSSGGFELAFVAAIFGGIGLLVDRWVGTTPVFTLALFFLASRIVPGLIARHPRWGVRDVADPASAPLFLALASLAM